MSIDWKKTYAAIWRNNKHYLRPVSDVDLIQLDSLVGIDRQKQELIRNTHRFLAHQPANNVLLWGARGTGKSSLVKAILNAFINDGLRLIEIYKNDLHNLFDIIDEIRELPQKFIIYCDDFSFEQHDSSYIALKSTLDGSIEKTPTNIIIYATSNRRHPVPESMDDNAQTIIADVGELHYSDAVEEKISLADRFGLHLSFYQPNMQMYLNIVDTYFVGFNGNWQSMRQAAQAFSIERGSQSGRTALQFYNYYSENTN